MKPRRFQFHLSTAMVMTFVVGGMVGLNFFPRQVKLHGLAGRTATVTNLGFPFVYQHERRRGGGGSEFFSPFSLLVNFGITIIPCMCLVEWWVRLGKKNSLKALRGVLHPMPLGATVLLALCLLMANIGMKRLGYSLYSTTSAMRAEMLVARGWPYASYNLVSGNPEDGNVVLFDGGNVCGSAPLNSESFREREMLKMAEEHADLSRPWPDIVLNALANFVFITGFLFWCEFFWRRWRRPKATD